MQQCDARTPFRQQPDYSDRRWPDLLLGRGALDACLGIHYRGVKGEWGAVDWGSIT